MTAMKPASSHPLIISGLVRCGSCDQLVQHHGIGTITALLLSLIHHRRTCEAMTEESNAA